LNDIALSSAAAGVDGGAVASTSSPFDSLYQGIRCGDLRIAISYRWARSIVESFDEQPIPKAPLWLAGATAVEGQIRPIVDIALLVNPSYARTTTKKDLHLLIGGQESGDMRDPPLALLFDGSPQQLREASGAAASTEAIPSAIAPFVERTVTSARNEVFYVVDVTKLADRLASELSTL
jgi:chemotaxis signal transduction protein